MAVEDLQTRRLRAARNQSLFREVNEQLVKLEGRFATSEPTVFVCECLEIGCAETVRVELDEYERLRRYPARFIVSPGHEDPAVEAVVEKKLRYWVVEKCGVGGELAAENDPRRATA